MCTHHNTAEFKNAHFLSSNFPMCNHLSEAGLCVMIPFFNLQKITLHWGGENLIVELDEALFM
jgi:hypothetical protein